MIVHVIQNSALSVPNEVLWSLPTNSIVPDERNVQHMAFFMWDFFAGLYVGVYVYGCDLNRKIIIDK